MPVCDAQYEIFTNNNIPDCVPQFHHYTPLVENHGGSQKTLFCRSVPELQPSTVQYVPGPLGPVEASTQVKRGFLGACFRDKFDKLPADHIQTVFETQLDQTESTPVVRPVKAKAYLLGKLTMEPGKYYKMA